MRSRLKLSTSPKVSQPGTLRTMRISMPLCGVAKVKSLSTALRASAVPNLLFCRKARQIRPPMEWAIRCTRKSAALTPLAGLARTFCLSLRISAPSPLAKCSIGGVLPEPKTSEASS
ncbi:hypothetical protein D9M71_466210 [compost metagenome]